jgi:hypothetical protein
MDFQFVNATPTNWVRLTTFNTPNQPNPRVRVRIPGGPNPVISFYAKAMVIPEPASLLLVSCLSAALAGVRFRR